LTNAALYAVGQRFAADPLSSQDRVEEVLCRLVAQHREAVQHGTWQRGHRASVEPHHIRHRYALPQNPHHRRCPPPGVPRDEDPVIRAGQAVPSRRRRPGQHRAREIQERGNLAYPLRERKAGDRQHTTQYDHPLAGGDLLPYDMRGRAEPLGLPPGEQALLGGGQPVQFSNIHAASLPRCVPAMAVIHRRSSLSLASC